MSHVTGTVQTVVPAVGLGPDFGPATNPPDTWTLSFAHTPAPTGSKLVILHFTAASLPAANRVEVDLGYDMDVFTAADGTDFWTRPINIYALAGGLIPIRYIRNGAANGGVQLDRYGRGERHAGIQDPTALSNCDPFLGVDPYAEPKYDPLWFCGAQPDWENALCVSPPADIRNTIEPAVGMVMHVDFHPSIGFHVSTCSVTLISPDTVITAGHCVASPIDDAKSASVIFNYRTNCNWHVPNGYVGRFFKVKEVIRQRYADGTANDYCLLRLVVPAGGLGIAPVPMRMDIPAAGEQVFGIHHPNGAVKKLSIPHPGFTTVIGSNSSAIHVNLDVSGGSSGSGLFDTAGRITGVLSNGGPCNLYYFPTATVQQDIATPTPIARDVMIVFDRSGSMSLPGTSGATKIEEARAAASLFVQLVRAGAGNRVGLVSFSTTASAPVDFPLANATAPNKNLLIGMSPFTGGVVGGLMPGGSTTIGGGLNAAYAQLPAVINPRNVLLLTDGLQNTPPLVNPTDAAPTDITIDVIGYGTPASLDGGMLTALAAGHRGHYVLADTNLKLQKFFALAFGNIFESGLVMDPELVLPAGQQAAAPLPFSVCGEEAITVVVGWDSPRTQLVIEVTTPSGAPVVAGAAGVESSSSRTWTFVRIPLPQNAERDGTWRVVVRRSSVAVAGVAAVEGASAGAAVHYFINVVASGGALLRRMPDSAKYFTGDVVNPLVGLQYIEGGLPDNAKLRVTVSRPNASVGNLLSEERLHAPVPIDADTIPARQATLMAIEQRTGRPAVGYTSHTFELFDDPSHTNYPEPAGIFGNPLVGLLTVEGNYTFHVEATYGDACVATRELLWSLHVDAAIDPTRTGVKTNVAGGSGTMTITPRDQFGNNVGPGRGDAFTFSNTPGTTVTGPPRDNGDGSYAVPVDWNASTGEPAGVIVWQPGREPVVLHDPEQTGRGRFDAWKWLFWLMVIIALLLLLALVFR